MSDWLLLQSGAALYIGLFLLLLGGAVGLPIPEDLPLITAGILIQAERVAPGLTFAVCYTGIISGDLIVYFVGRRFGTALFKSKFFKSRVSSSRVRHVRLRLEKRSILMIFLARHLFYMRTVTFLTCGAVKMNLRTFLAADAAAALISAPLMIGLGYLAAEHYEEVLKLIEQAKTVSVIVGAILLAAGVIYYLHRRSQARAAAEEDASAVEQ